MAKIAFTHELDLVQFAYSLTHHQDVTHEDLLQLVEEILAGVGDTQFANQVGALGFRYLAGKAPTQQEVQDYVTRTWGDRLQPWQADLVVDFILNHDYEALPKDPQIIQFIFLAACRFDRDWKNGDA